MHDYLAVVQARDVRVRCYFITLVKIEKPMRLLIMLVAVLAFGADLNRPAAADNDVVGKVVAGYQGWFACAGDGTPVGNLKRWAHWSRGAAPAPGNQSFELWPDVREFGTDHTFPTGYATAAPPGSFPPIKSA